MDQLDDRQSLKRKRSPDPDLSGTSVAPPKAAKTSNHLAINYLARQRSEDTPLISTEDTLPSLIQTLGDYAGILDRHESMAFNLGAKPLGPILVRRFEGYFNAPPKVLTSHGKEKATVSWLDVVEFARNKPEQFTLAQMSEGAPVCQIHLKQCRVQISEEDFLLINSGMPQKLIPPQPVLEDEEKELGTLEILEQYLGTIVQMADQVAAKGRQLRHRIGSRKQAILDRRAADPLNTTSRPSSPSNIALMNSGNGTSSSGFTAVNNRLSETNGTVVELGKTGASEGTRQELLKQFATVKHLKKLTNSEAVYTPEKAVQPPPRHMSNTPVLSREETQPLYQSIRPSPNPQYYQTQSTTPKDNEGPYKAEMIARVETIKRGDRILPPCDRCRRLHMDCVKNLTACLGCTKKHAKCSWKEVRAYEIAAPIVTPSAASDVVDAENSLEYHLRRATQESSDTDVRLNVNGTASTQHQDASSRTIAMSAAAAGLAAVAKASNAALEADMDHVRATTEHHNGRLGQSPNLIQSSTHQSPNISSYGTFSPPHHTPHSSINMPYASGRRISSPALIATEDHGSVADLKYDVGHGLEKDGIDLRNGDGLLAS